MRARMRTLLLCSESLKWLKYIPKLIYYEDRNVRNTVKGPSAQTLQIWRYFHNFFYNFYTYLQKGKPLLQILWSFSLEYDILASLNSKWLFLWRIYMMLYTTSCFILQSHTSVFYKKSWFAYFFPVHIGKSKNIF